MGYSFNRQGRQPMRSGSQTAPSEGYFNKKRTSVFAATQLRSQREALEFKPPVFEKSQAEIDELITHLKNSFLTKNMGLDQIKVIAMAMKKVEKKQGELIIKYGEVGREYYILKSGTVRVLVYKQGTKKDDPKLAEKVERTKDLGAGIGFGEIALMYGDKRTASILATSDCVCWELDGAVFKNIIVNNVVKRRNIEVGYLDKVDIFNKVDKLDKLKLIDGLETVYFEKGLNIITEGDDGDYFYIIEEGEVECYKKEGDQEISIRKLGKGDHFGEIALIKDEKRTLSVRADSEKAKLLALNRESFTRILGSIEKYLKKDYSA